MSKSGKWCAIAATMEVYTYITPVSTY